MYPLRRQRDARSRQGSQDVLLSGPAVATPAPAELARNNMRNKLPPIALSVPPRQATFFSVQSAPIADGLGRFVTICTPPHMGVPVLVSTRLFYLLASIALLIASHQGLPHGGLTAPMDPKARSPTHTTRPLPNEHAPTDEAGFGPSICLRMIHWSPTASSMSSSPESPKTRRARQDVLGEKVAKQQQVGQGAEEAHP
ncbi:hypothetical protein FRC12_012129, partial [Ceratobasidium sp. 428]